MPPEQALWLNYTIEHFKEIARQNRFAENAGIEHQSRQCLICHPELFPVEPFVIYLRVAAESVKVRRPCLDQSLVDEINNDLELMGKSNRVSKQSLLEGDPVAFQAWLQWVREALDTGLGLLSVHSATSLEFTLERAEAHGLGNVVAARVEEIMAFQKQGTEEVRPVEE